MTPAPSVRVPSRPASSRMLLMALAIIGIFAFLALPAWGFAADSRTGSDITISSSERVTDDLYIAAGTLEFAGTAEGEVAVAAGQATMTGPIAGSLSIGAGTAEISSDIGGALRILGGRVEVTGDVGGDLVIGGGEVTVTSSAEITGNIIMAGGRLTMNGQVGGDIRGYVVTAEIGGTVGGNIDMWSNDLSFTNSARITGQVVQTGQSEADVASGAQLTGGIQHNDVNPWGDGNNPLSRASGAMLRTLWMLVTGALIVILAPRLANQLGTNGKRIIPALPMGVLALIAVPIVALVLMITVIGFTAGMVTFFLFMIGLYLSQAVVGITLGRYVLPKSWNDGSRGFHLLAMTLGVLFIAAFRFVPFPWVWSGVSLFVTIWGIGAMLMMIPVLSRQERVGV